MVKACAYYPYELPAIPRESLGSAQASLDKDVTELNLVPAKVNNLSIRDLSKGEVSDPYLYRIWANISSELAAPSEIIKNSSGRFSTFDCPKNQKVLDYANGLKEGIRMRIWRNYSECRRVLKDDIKLPEIKFPQPVNELLAALPSIRKAIKDNVDNFEVNIREGLAKSIEKYQKICARFEEARTVMARVNHERSFLPEGGLTEGITTWKSLSLRIRNALGMSFTLPWDSEDSRKTIELNTLENNYYAQARFLEAIEDSDSTRGPSDPMRIYFSLSRDVKTPSLKEELQSIGFSLSEAVEEVAIAWSKIKAFRSIQEYPRVIMQAFSPLSDNHKSAM